MGGGEGKFNCIELLFDYQNQHQLHPCRRRLRRRRCRFCCHRRHYSHHSRHRRLTVYSISILNTKTAAVAAATAATPLQTLSPVSLSRSTTITTDIFAVKLLLLCLLFHSKHRHFVVDIALLLRL